MSRYKPPRELIEGLKPLSIIPSEVLGEFLAALDATAAVSISIEDDIVDFSTSVHSLKDVSATERSALCEALVGVHYLRATPGLTEAGFLADVEEAALNAEYTTDALSNLLNNVRQALRSRVLRASIKAWALLNDEERIYLHSRILTDVRPVFDDEDAGRLLASVIVHTLKIATRVDGRVQGVYVSLDSDDLKELRNVIDRALEKADAAGAQLTDTSFAPTLGASTHRS